MRMRGVGSIVRGAIVVFASSSGVCVQNRHQSVTSRASRSQSDRCIFARFIERTFRRKRETKFRKDTEFLSNLEPFAVAHFLARVFCDVASMLCCDVAVRAERRGNKWLRVPGSDSVHFAFYS